MKYKQNKICLVATTISNGDFLDFYSDKIKKENLADDVFIIIIPDLKTPSILYQKCDLLKKQGINIVCPTIQEQENFLKKLGKIFDIIPYNSDNRRNVGFLMAIEMGCDLLISVDDDNFPLEENYFFKHHGIVGTVQKLPVLKTNSKWFNICDLMKKNPNQKIYARGYPYNRRWLDSEVKEEKREAQIMLNAGLWLNDPDIDALTRINRDIKTTEFIGRQVVLDIGTWSPINTQNTCLHSDLLPAYYYVLMGEKIDNLIIDRYGDIWSGFFVKKVMDFFGYYVSVGDPVANHIRNKHNLFKDLKQELGCMIQTDLLVDFLENVSLKGKTVSDVYVDLADKFLDYSLKDIRFSDDFKKYAKKLNNCQKIWLETIQKIKK